MQRTVHLGKTSLSKSGPGEDGKPSTMKGFILQALSHFSKGPKDSSRTKRIDR